jgi:hypothetical protein
MVFAVQHSPGKMANVFQQLGFPATARDLDFANVISYHGY